MDFFCCSQRLRQIAYFKYMSRCLALFRGSVYGTHSDVFVFIIDILFVYLHIIQDGAEKTKS